MSEIYVFIHDPFIGAHNCISSRLFGFFGQAGTLHVLDINC